MKLDEFYARIAPLLEGRRSVTQVAPLLYTGESKDSRRLAIYADFCAHHRRDALGHVFAATASALDGLQATPWMQWVDSYFAAHPMHHVELNENGVMFPLFLKGHPKVPEWIAQLADLEWWEWQTINVARHHEEPLGLLRLSGTVEIRPYDFDLLRWVDGPSAKAPVSRSGFVVFWRDREDHLRREWLNDTELRVLAAVSSQTPIGDDAESTVEDLHAAGILVGVVA